METRKGIQIKDFSLNVSGRSILRHVTMEVPWGGLAVLSGSSGSGKTSLLRSINRLHQNDRVQGSICVDLGGNLCNVYDPRTNQDYLRKKVGMLFQTPQLLPFPLSKGFCLPLQVACNLSRAQAVSIMEQALKDVGIWGEVAKRLGHLPGEFSVGQQQRIALAQILAMGGEVLLLDEPTASLDEESAQIILKLIAGLRSRYTILVATHQAELFGRHADVFYRLKDGVIMQGQAAGRSSTFLVE